MASERKSKRDNEEQSRRFEETARELGADESGKKFERVFKKIAPVKKGQKKHSS